MQLCIPEGQSRFREVRGCWPTRFSKACDGSLAGTVSTNVRQFSRNIVEKSNGWRTKEWPLTSEMLSVALHCYDGRRRVAWGSSISARFNSLLPIIADIWSEEFYHNEELFIYYKSLSNERWWKNYFPFFMPYEAADWAEILLEPSSVLFQKYTPLPNYFSYLNVEQRIN